MSSEHSICKLCQHKVEWYCEFFKVSKSFYRCTYCKAIYRDSKTFVNTEIEEKRYRTHNNDVYDERYQKFVSPVTNAISRDFPNTVKGLDYGCGTGPVATFILEQKGYDIKLYDPFFYPDTSFENEKYDFIICCEVMEHFFNPQAEFQKLKQLLKPHGKLYCKTKMITDGFSVDNFKRWYYKNDPTHVFFYSPKTLEVIQELFGFTTVTFDEKLIIFHT